MECGICKKLIIAMTMLMLITIIFAAKCVCAQELTGAGSWFSNEGSFEVIEERMVLEGKTGTAVFENEHDMNGTIVFDARFSFRNRDDSWIAFKLRSDEPQLSIWQNSSTYFFLIRNNSIIAGKVTDGNPVEYFIEQRSSLLSDGKFHKIEIGIINQGEKSIPRLVFAVDGKTIIEYDDFTADNRHKFLNSLFSVNVFLGGRVEIETLPDTGKTYGDRVMRELPDSNLQNLDSYNEKWAIVQYIGPGSVQYYKTGFERDEDSLILVGPGSLVYKDKMSLRTISFDLKMTEHEIGKTGTVTILLNKSERDSYFGDESYGFIFSSDGRAYPVVYTGNEEKRYPGIKTDLSFSQKRNVMIEWLKTDDGLTFYLYIDGSDCAFEYKLEGLKGLSNDIGFLGVLNNSLTTTLEISSIKYEGETEAYLGDSEIMPVYLQDYIIDEGICLLHWEYRADEESYYKAVITDADEFIIGEVYYPVNTFLIPEESIYDYLFIHALNIDGTESEKVMVNLDNNKNLNLENNSERIAIKSDNVYGAHFVYSESKKEFFINGFNYIKLRFGDHSTFEPATGILQADYDPYSAESMFKLLKSMNYNTVRIFVANGRTYGNPGTAGEYTSSSKISGEYMENIADFLRRAQKYGIYVIVCFGENDVPDNHYFNNLVPYSNQQDFLFNERYMKSKLEYISLFLNYVKNSDSVLLKSILAIQEQNEFCYNPHVEPFSLTEGLYTFYGNNTIYDLSNEDSRRTLANDALQYYVRNVKKAIDDIDADILLTIGTSTLNLAGVKYPEDKGIFPYMYNNHPLTAAEYLRTDIDFLDIHSYNFADKSLKGRDTIIKDVESMLLKTSETIELRKNKPVILGEFGSVIGVQDKFESAKLFIIEQRNTAVENNFKGVLHWTFDAFSQNELFSAMEDNGVFVMQLSLFKPFNLIMQKDQRNNMIPLTLGFGFVSGVFIVVVFIFRKRNKRNSSIKINNTVRAASTDSELSLFTEVEQPFICNFFGEFELHYMGRQITDKVFLSVKARDLLIYMLNENRKVSKDEIIEAIWGEKDNADPNNLFHVTMYKLRKSLKSVDGSWEYIECKNRLYSVEPGLFFCIHEQFGHDMEELLGKDNLSEYDSEKIQRNIIFYKNKYLYSYDYKWTHVKREYFHGLYEKALLISARYYFNRSELVYALRNSNLLVKSNPYYEKAYILILSIYRKQGNKKEFARTCEMYKNLLRDDLGIRPSEEFEKFCQTLEHN